LWGPGSNPQPEGRGCLPFSIPSLQTWKDLVRPIICKATHTCQPDATVSWALVLHYCQSILGASLPRPMTATTEASSRQGHLDF
jgi:hypothetical protein